MWNPLGEQGGAKAGRREKEDSDVKPKRQSLDLALSNFVCGDILADGSTATIVAARSVRGTIARANIPDKDIVLKSIPKFAVSQRCRKQLHREIEIHMRIGIHPNIVSMYASLEDEHGVYLVMERLYGPTLHRVIRRNGSLSEKFTLQITDQILEGISYMHSRGYSHRDLSSKNIMFREWPSLQSGKLHVMLIDMGHACYRRPEAAVNARHSSEKIGTLPFMAPEVYSEVTYLPETCDIWSIGVLMYMMITGDYPYVGETRQEMAGQVYKETLSLKGKKWNRVSDATKGIVRSLLCPVPYLRPDTNRVKREVQAVLSGRPLPDLVEKPYRERKEYAEHQKKSIVRIGKFR